MMISDNWGDFLLPILRRIFDKHLKPMKDFLPVLYNVENSKKAQEFTHGVGSMGLMDEWEASGRQVSYETVHPGFKATYTHMKFSKGLPIERELLDDALYPEVKKQVRKLADSKYYTYQYHVFRPFNECLSFIGPDKVPLASTEHPLGPYNSTTWSNYGTGLTLNATNVELVRNRMKEWKDDKGNLLLINPDTLLVPKSLRKPALVVADTDKEPDTAENNVNIWKGSVNVIEGDFLTNSNMWFFIDMNRMKQFLTWFNRRIPVLQQDKENFDTEVSRYKLVGRWSYGFDDPSFVYVAVQ
jgi:hypothetical protein